MRPTDCDTASQAGPPKAASWLDSVDIISGVVLLFEVFVGCVSMGFAGHWSCWLHTTDFHKLDLFVLIVTITEYVALFGFGVQVVTMRPFRLLRIFRAITKIRFFAGIKTILITLKLGVQQLFIVFAMLMFFIASFSIFGMAIFQHSFARRCVSIPQPTPACSSGATFDGACRFNDFKISSFLNKSDTDYNQSSWSAGGSSIVAGGYPFERFCKTYVPGSSSNLEKSYPYDPVQDLYHTCGIDQFVDTPEGYGGTVYQTCVEIGNPSNGFSHFDNIAGAFASIFQVTSGDSGFDILWWMLESEPDVYWLSFVFYFIIIAMNKFLLLGLFVAVVTGTFARVRMEHGSAFLSHEEEDDAYTGAGSRTGGTPSSRGGSRGGFFGLTTANETNATKDGKLIHPSRDRRRHEKPQNLVLEGYLDEDLEDGPIQDGLVQEYAKLVLHNPAFGYFFSVVITLNLLAAAADQPYTTPEWKAFAFWSYIICCILFWVELLVRYTAASSFAEFQSSSLVKVEFVLCVVNTIGLYIPQRLDLVSCLRMYRLMVYLPTLQHLLMSALSSIDSIMNLVVFLFIVALCVNVTGRYLFGSQMDSLTRSNFGEFSLGLITIFQILAGDGWSGVWYSAIATKDSEFGRVFAGLFLGVWWIFANVIVYNLFIAVIIENFSVAETIANIGKPGHVASVRGMIKDAYMELAKSGGNAHRGKYKVWSRFSHPPGSASHAWWRAHNLYPKHGVSSQPWKILELFAFVKLLATMRLHCLEMLRVSMGQGSAGPEHLPSPG